MTSQQSWVLWIGLFLIVANLIVGKGAATLGALFSGGPTSSGTGSAALQALTGNATMPNAAQRAVYNKTVIQKLPASVGGSYNTNSFPLEQLASKGWGSLYNMLHAPPLP